MDGAKKTTDVLDVFKQLTDTQGQIDIVQGQIKYYAQSVAFSLITITLEPKPVSAIERLRSWDFTKVGQEAYQNLLNQLETISYSLIRFFIFYLPLLLIWGFITLILFFLGKTLYQRFNKRK